ncbi:unnamed protein product, partial [Brenthis ino]
MSDNNNFPYEYEKLSPEENKELMDYMNGFQMNFIRIGPKGYFFSDYFMTHAPNIYNMEIKSDDVFVATFPKSGTTLMQELVWLVRNNLDFEKAKAIKLNDRFPFLEESTIAPHPPSTDLPATVDESVIKSLMPMTVDQIKALPSPRFIKTHLPMSLLPPNLLDTAKVVYVARDPRDVAVSFFHHKKLMRVMSQEPEFKPYWKYFMENKVIWSPYFEHLLEAWGKRNHPNLLFLFYEDLVKDLPSGIRRVAKFLDKQLTDDEVANLSEHLKFDNFKKNKSVNMEDFQKIGIFRNDGGFVRKGKSGGWREHFDEEMTAEADEWIKNMLRSTDFRFPHM